MKIKQIPEMVTQLNNLGASLKQLKALNISTVGLNSGNIDAYKNALAGLSTEQSVLALSSQGATDAQIRQILVTDEAMSADVELALAKAGLTTSTNALTQAEMIELATQKGMATATAEELLSKLGITAAENGQVAIKKVLTAEMIKQAVANKTLTAAEGEQLLGIFALNGAETVSIGLTNVLTGAITNLWTIISSHPIGAILTAIGAIAVGVVRHINKTTKEAKQALIDAHNDAQQALDDSQNELSSEKSKLESINSELSDTKQKIQDISSQGTITLTDQNELDKLSTTNQYLETQGKILENNIKLKEKEKAMDAKSLLGTQVESEYANIQDGTTVVEKTESYNYEDTAKYQAHSLKNAYTIYMNALKDGDVKKQELAKELIDTQSANIGIFTTELLDIVNNFKDSEGNIISGYENIYDQYMGYIYNLQSLTDPKMFMDIAKQATAGKNIDYEKAISDGYALAYEGEFDIEKLDQDFVQALVDSGIDKSTIEYMFNLKQQEYSRLIDTIDSKYDSSKVNYSYWDANGNTHHDYDKENSEIQRIEETNTALKEYAKNNPIEFETIMSDGGLDKIDEYINQAKEASENAKTSISEAKAELESLEEEGNVDLTIRPVIDSSEMKKAGYDVEDGSISTTFTSGEFIWQGDEENGQYVYVHYTPILPDGTVLTPGQLSDYLYNTLEGSQNILDADSKGLVLKVDTDLQGISEDDIKNFQNGNGSTEAIDSFLGKASDWDNKVHEVQENFYLAEDTAKDATDNVSSYVKTAMNNLANDIKAGTEGIPNETNISSFEDIWNSSNFAKSREKLEKLAKSGELTSETLQSTDDYKKLLEETGLTADEVKNKIEEMVLSLTDSTSNIRNAITQFDDIYNQIKDGKAVDSDKLTGLDSSFGEINGGESLKEFKEVLTTMPGDIEASQKALDKLATEYIDQSGLIKNLNKDNKEWTKQELKKIGIINADEVVESRLSKITDEMAKKLKYCSKTIKDNEKAIRNHSEGSEEVISNVSNTIKEILGLSDLDFDLNFDSDFILENLNDIQEAANGSVEALDRLRVNSAKEIIANMHVEGDIQQEIYDLIDGLDLPNVEVGTGLDKTPFIKGLNDMIAAGKITANAVSSILSGMGVKATISTVTAPMKIASFAGYTRLPDGSLKEKLVTRTIEHAISAPQISYSSKGGGSTAHYSSPNPSSSGGSGGGGGGSSSEPQNTTYDWIEKKIKRVDEALSRLQKKESNVFSGWTDRTKALNDEISETSEKIKLMQDASNKYQEKANSIGLSQTYINRIQNGELRIEDVKDEKLKEKIEAYQEWYEKSVECSDQIQDLNIQLSEFAKQKFDNIVTQFENIQSVISAKSDLYNAYIDIATEQGRLVGKAYYSSLLDTEKSKKKSLEDELSKLKESLNSSVAEGRITVKSESWYELVGKINDVNAAILEADKNIVEFGNNIRQLKWDSFDLAQDKIGLVIDELQFVNDTLIASKKTIDGEGSDNGLTEYGKASLSTMSELYMIYTEQAKKYAIEANRIKSEEDMDDQNVIDRYNEMLEKQRESISNIQSQKDALIDLARNGYDAVLEAMQKTIDLKNKQLNSEKALYEYQKNIAEKSKNIALLEKQQAVYENDDSEEGKKRLQEIKVNLEKSKQDLKDTEYDKWLEQQQTMMDDLYNGYSDKIDEKFDNTDSLIKELIGVSSDSNKLIQEIANAFGYQLSGETVGINSLNDVSTMIANIVQAVANRVANANNSANTNIELVNGKIQGFASGGIVGDLQKVAYGNGDDAITINTLKKGEAIMTPDETIQFKKLIDNLVPLNSIIDNAMIKNVIPNKNAISNQSVNFVIEKIELENVNNPNEFVKGLSTAFKSPEVIKMVQTISTDVMLGKSIKNINKF